MKFIVRIVTLLLLVIVLKTNAQIIIPASNIRNGGSIPCSTCQPKDWFRITGTPDMSNKTTVADNNTAGGGTKWKSEPLTLPPNKHEAWITIRDVGPSAEEALGTTLSNLTIGNEYEIVIYSMTALQDTYSRNYLSEFTFRVTDEYPKVNDTPFETKYPRTTVTNISKDTDKTWGVSKLRFKANNTTMYLAIYPGRTATNNSASTYKSVNLSVTANSINTMPVAQNKTTTAKYGEQVIVNVMEGVSDSDAGQQVMANSVDLNPTINGLQKTLDTEAGTWIVDNNGIVTFTPKNGFYGTTSIQYTIQDNYTTNGTSTPGTSTPKTITVTMAQPCTEPVNGSDFEVRGGNSKTFTMPAADFGFQFDIYELDNSFNLDINGVNLATKEIEFQQNGMPANSQNIRFKDGTIWEKNSIPDIWRLIGTKENPIIRVIIDPNGIVTMFGSKTSGGKLEPLELFNGNTFNNITWNTTRTNTVITHQNVVGNTVMKGYGSGLKVVPCACVKTPNTQTADANTTIGVSTKAVNSNKWPNIVPNGFIALESSNKGMVITRLTNASQVTDPKEGMIIYDKTDACVKLYNGSSWKCIQKSCND